MFNKISISVVLAWLVAIGNQLVPVLPPVWANLVSAVIAVYALYHTGKVVAAARAQGIKGI